ncbi:mannose-6-phosphate isomerase 1-like protein [Tanacetum coccineum]
MLAPSGGGLIIYQAYGNLYAMTGRKAHLFKDKQIPSVGVFDEVFSIWKAFGGNTHNLGSFGEETDKTTNQHQDSSRFKVSAAGDGVTIHTRRCHTSSSDGVTTFLDGHVCLYTHDPRDPHFTALKRILRYVRGTIHHGLQIHISSIAELIYHGLLSVGLLYRTPEAEYCSVAIVVVEMTLIRDLLCELHTPILQLLLFIVIT